MSYACSLGDAMHSKVAGDGGSYGSSMFMSWVHGGRMHARVAAAMHGVQRHRCAGWCMYGSGMRERVQGMYGAGARVMSTAAAATALDSGCNALCAASGYGVRRAGCRVHAYAMHAGRAYAWGRRRWRQG